MDRMPWALIFILFTAIGGDAEEKRETKRVTVYREEGRFGGWPANHGIWAWGDEILVGFSRGYYQDMGDRHHIDRERPEEHWFARSVDGGETWELENASKDGVIVPRGRALHGAAPPDLTPPEPMELDEPIDFTHPDFAMTLRMMDVNTGPSLLYYSYDRGRRWRGPYRFPDLDTPGIAARTDFIVNGLRDCFVFVTAAKSDGRQGRVLQAHTDDGGLTWRRVSWIGPEPEGFAIMPSTARLSENELLTALRRREGERRWIETYRSTDNGETWAWDGAPVPSAGIGNPGSLVRLRDGRLCLTYGYRAEPYAIHARLSDDNGTTWSEPIIVRGEGGGSDLGYTQTVQRADGKMVTIYYFQDQLIPERYIEATIWTP